MPIRRVDRPVVAPREHRQRTLRHRAGGLSHLEPAAGTGYQRSWLTGMWGAEWQLHTEPMQTGTAVLESRKGSTSHQNTPWFSIGKTAETTEESGPVCSASWAGAGSWRNDRGGDRLHLVRVTAATTHSTFHWVLKAGDYAGDTKVLRGLYGRRQRRGASRIEHRFQTDEILPMRTATTPAQAAPHHLQLVGSHGDAFTDQTQIALAEKSGQARVERFVIDDGWFGQRNDDHAAWATGTSTSRSFPTA